MSDWKAGAAKRRDARHTKTTEPHRPVAGKKDTKRWCGGKVDREHKPKCFARRLGIGSDVFSYELSCTECGKRLEYWYPRWTTRPKPVWVVDAT